MRHFAVFGHPIAHSRSPRIHSLFAEQMGDDLEYRRQDVSPGTFTTAVREFFEAGGAGLNITLPYKEEACQLADWRSPGAERAHSANTLWRDEQGRLCADTTDGEGLCRDLQRQGMLFPGARVLLLGAGGAAKAVIAPLLESGIAALDLCNRTPQRALDIVSEMRELGPLQRCLAGAEVAPYDLLINATSASLQQALPAMPALSTLRGSACYDMMYAAADTPFIAWCKAQGASSCSDGLGMLVEQAASSYQRWWGRRPETLGVIETLRREMQAG